MQKLHPRAYLARYMYAINVNRIIVINLKNGQYTQIRTNGFTPYSRHRDPVSSHSHAFKCHLPPPDPQHITYQTLLTKTGAPIPRRTAMGEGTQCRAREARKCQCHTMDSRQRPPPGAKLISLTMGYKYKRTAEGDITERKAQCSLRGDLMRPHQRYNPDHTAAPMADKITIRLLLAVKAAYGLPAAHLDIKSAFTHETYKYDADVYVKQHPRFDGTYKHGGKGSKLIRNVYGSPSGGTTTSKEPRCSSNDTNIYKANRTPASSTR